MSPVTDKYLLVFESINNKYEHFERLLAQAIVLSSDINDNHQHQLGPNYEEQINYSVQGYPPTNVLCCIYHIVILCYITVTYYCFVSYFTAL